MAGGGRRCEVTKLLEASTGKVLVRLEEIDQQGIYLVDVQQGRAVLVLCTFEFRFFNQIFLQRCIGTEIHGFDADVLSVHVGWGYLLRGRQSQTEIADAFQMHMVSVAQMEDQLVVQLGQHRLDVAHGQGASLVDVLGDFVGVDGRAVGHPGVVGGLSLAIGCRRRRVNVEFNSYISE